METQGNLFVCLLIPYTHVFDLELTDTKNIQMTAKVVTFPVSPISSQYRFLRF